MTLNPESPTRHFWLVLFSAAFTLAIAGVTGGIAYTAYNQTQVWQRLQHESDRQAQQQAQLSQLEQAQQYRQNNDLATCRKIIHDVPIDPVYRQLRQALVAACYGPLNQAWLAEARQHQAQAQHAEAIAIAQQIQEGAEQLTAQQLIERSSRQILRAAEDRYLSPDTAGFADAIRWASTLKPKNPLFSEAQMRIRNWRQEWEANLQHWETANQARREGNLPLAKQAARRISPHPFWTNHRSALLAQITVDHERYANLHQQAVQALTEKQVDLAAQRVNLLPDYAPWAARKAALQRQLSIELPTREDTFRQVTNWLFPTICGMIVGYFVSLWHKGPQARF